MKCPFCAEEIQDEAILCRFCSATQVDSVWLPPGRAAAKPPGALNLKVAGALAVLSALFEIGSVSGAVPLFGAVYEGTFAWIYHLFYVALFGAMGVGLLRLAPWTPRLVYGGTAVYSLEKIAYALSSSTRAADIAHQTKAYGSLLQMVDTSMLDLVSQLTAALSAASFIGFAGYVYYRRRSFRREPHRPGARPSPAVGTR